MSMIPVIQQKRFEQMDEFIRSISYGGELYHIFERENSFSEGMLLISMLLCHQH